MTFTGPGPQQPGNLFGQEQWARRGEAQAAAASVAIPVGVINAYYGTTAPAGWLICDGSAFSAATYPQLATLLGGTTLPDFRQRFPLGKAAAGTGSTLGGTGGSKDASAVTHNHTQNAHGHTGGTGINDHNHAHLYNADDNGGGTIGLTPGASNYALLSRSLTTGNQDANHSHTFTTNDATAVNQSAGSSGTDANLPPWLAVSFIIKAS